MHECTHTLTYPPPPHTHTHTQKLSGMLPTGYVGSLENESYPTSEEEEEEELEEEELEEEEESGMALASALRQEMFKHAK